jgi:hypothetical protein
MNFARAALLSAAAILAGCAAPTKERADTAKRSPLMPAQERPGLGTAWGEQRESWIEPAPFQRASTARPASQARIYYNDPEGVNAMLDFLGGQARPCAGLQQSPGGMLRFGLRTGNGAWLDCRESHGRRIATGARGERYEVLLKNDARRAIEVLVSVDGLDAMDGRPASFQKRGYVLAPYETLAVEGFRTSRSTVAAFRFGPMFESYGHRRHGDTVNAGVIGVAVFDEKRRTSPGEAPPAAGHAWRATAARPMDERRDFSPPPEA